MEAWLQEAPPHQRALLLQRFEVFDELSEIPSHTKGRPVRPMNLQAIQEDNVLIVKLRRKCGISEQSGHNGRTCPNQNDSTTVSAMDRNRTK